MLIVRTIFGMHDLVTIRHLDLMNTFMLATGLMVGYAYAMEFFVAWYSGNPYESWVFMHNRLGFGMLDEEGNWGPLWWSYWAMVSCNVLAPQIFWFKKLPHFHPGDVRRDDLHQHRDVVRAFRHHRDVALPRLHPGELGQLQRDVGRHRPLRSAPSGSSSRFSCFFIRWVPMIAIAEVKATLAARASPPRGRPRTPPGARRFSSACTGGVSHG